MRRIYLDYNASTPIDPAVVAAMRPLLEDAYGNSSRGHWAGQLAREGVENARTQVAKLLGCSAGEIVFTSGGSEANNQALKGVAFALRDKGDHIITSTVEHPAILNPCAFLGKLGYRVTHVPVDHFIPTNIRRAITPKTILVSVIHSNNEVGTIQPIEEIGRITHHRGLLLHTDAAQSVGKIATNVDALGVDLLTIAGHKLYAPKGVGALYVRRGGRRARTESALLAVELGAACELARDLEPIQRVRALRDRFWQQLQARFGNRMALNGHPEYRLPNTLTRRDGEPVAASDATC